MKLALSPLVLTLTTSLTLTLAATLPIAAWSTHQHILLDPALHQKYRPSASSNRVAKYLDAAPNTVGVLFMTSTDEGVHVWLPLGERVFVRDSWVLPATPMTARITGMVGETRDRARLDVLEAVICGVFSKAGRGMEEDGAMVRFRSVDELVRLVAKGGLLEGGEVESYECA